jgi:hypothetical protein
VNTQKNQRPRSIDRARLAFNAALPRQGRIAKQCHRCFVARDGVATMRELRQWCYPRQDRQHWHHWSIVRALRKLGDSASWLGDLCNAMQHRPVCITGHA